METTCKKCCHIQKRSYYTFNYPGASAGSKTLLTGIRGVYSSPKVYICGFYESDDGTQSFVYKGKINGVGAWYNFSYPSDEDEGRTVTSTNLYGPNNGFGPQDIRVVGSYMTAENPGVSLGCLYEGPISNPNKGRWTTLIPTSVDPVLGVIAHSTMGYLIVGNYITEKYGIKAFIYDMRTGIYYDMFKEGATNITVYGCWHNFGEFYTICGSYKIPSDETRSTHSSRTFQSKSRLMTVAYVVDFNNVTHELCNWGTYAYDNDLSEARVTHFNGITGGKIPGSYNLTGDWIGTTGTDAESGFGALVTRDKKGKFNEKAIWSDISYPNKFITSGNSIYKNVVIGVYASDSDLADSADSAEDDGTNGFISY